MTDIFDILQSKLSVPDTVYVVGSGRESQSTYTAIPNRAFVIVVNGAIEAPVMPSIWLMGDPEVITKRWFKPKMHEFCNSGHDIRPHGIHPGCSPVPVLSDGLIVDYPWVRTFFVRREKLYNENEPMFDRGNGTISIQASTVGAAVELAYYLGAHEIKLIGVRFDGRYNVYRQPFEYMARQLSLRGVNVKMLREEIKQPEPLEALKPKEPKRYLPEFRKANGIPMLLDADLQLPSRVVIVGSGPNLDVSKIWPTDYVIALNRAINFPDIKPNMWLVADGNCAEDPKNKEWFEDGCKRCKDDGIKKVWSFAVRDRAGGHNPDYLIRLVPHHEKGYRQVPDKFRPDETVAGIALDITQRFACKSAILCGIDMSGAVHRDGTDAPGNCDDAHGEIWDSRDALDDAIRWHQSHGMRVSTMSPTMLREPYAYVDDKLPTVALLTMAFDPVNTKESIFCAAIQDYPPHLLTQYLMTQNNEQPRVATDVPFRIVQIDDEGVWPELWLTKLLKFFEHCTEDYTVIFDEDDRFVPGYTITAIRELLDKRKPVAWTFKNRLVDRFRIRTGYYRSPIGTLVGETDVLFELAKELWEFIYGFEWYPGCDKGNYPENSGAQDANWRDMLIRHLEGVEPGPNPLPGEARFQAFEFGENIIPHDGERWYREHANSNTCTGRQAQNAIDYFRPKMWWKGTTFEEARPK